MSCVKTGFLKPKNQISCFHEISLFLRSGFVNLGFITFLALLFVCSRDRKRFYYRAHGHIATIISAYEVYPRDLFIEDAGERTYAEPAYTNKPSLSKIYLLPFDERP
jgi:hypothetical protein